MYMVYKMNYSYQVVDLYSKYEIICVRVQRS